MTKLKRPRAPVLAGTVLAAALAGVALSSCGTAPYAATVDGASISEEQLAAQARYWASSPAFVQYEDAQFASEAAEAEEEGQSNVPLNTVQGNGTGPGVYGMYWTTLELSDMITTDALGHYLSARHDAPSSVQDEAAWSAEWAEDPTIWSQVGSSARSSGAAYDAERAQLLPVTSAKADQKFYSSHAGYFWSSVCLLTGDVSLLGSNGSVDLAASKAQAEKDAVALRANPAAPPASVSNGSHYCDTPEQFFALPASFQSQVQALAPGQVVVLPESWGYEVVQVTSRSSIPYSSTITPDIEVVTTDGGAQGQPNSETRVIRVLKSAHVRVNPAFGTWATNLPSPYAPEVLPPGESG